MLYVAAVDIPEAVPKLDEQCIGHSSTAAEHNHVWGETILTHQNKMSLPYGDMIEAHPVHASNAVYNLHPLP